MFAKKVNEILIEIFFLVAHVEKKKTFLEADLVPFYVFTISELLRFTFLLLKHFASIKLLSNSIVLKLIEGVST